MQLASQLKSLCSTPFISYSLETDLTAIEQELAKITEPCTEINALDQLFFEMVQSAANERESKSLSVLEQLLSLYRSAGQNFASNLVTWNLHRFALSYAALCLTVPGLFEGGIEADPARFVEICVCRDVVLFPSFWSDLAGVVDGDVFGEIVRAVLIAALQDCRREGLLSPRVLATMSAIIAPLAGTPQSAAIIFTDIKQETPQLTIESVKETLLGTFFALAAVDSPANFEAIKSVLPVGYEPPISLHVLLSAYDTVRGALQVLIENLHQNILLPLIRNNPHCDVNPKDVLLDWIIKVISLNKNRGKLQADPASINSDGFIMSVWLLLLRFCDPFTFAPADVLQAKLAIIDVNFCFTFAEWSEADRVAMNTEDFKAFKTTVKGAENYNFITKIFFLTLQMLKLGPLRLIQEYGMISREFVELENEQNQLNETQETWMRLPNAPMIRRFLVKIKDRMRQLVDLRIAFDLHLQDSQSKKSTLALLSFFTAYYTQLPKSAQSALPEFFLEGMWEYLMFMSRTDPDFLTTSVPESLIQLGASLIPNGEAIKNPYIRAKIAELFFGIVSEDKLQLLSPPIMEMLVPNLIKLYVQVEALGSSTAFYDKFSIRYHITKILLKLVQYNEALFKAIPRTLDDTHLVRFLNLCVSDSTYLLDESLSKLAEIREKEQNRANLSPEDQKSLAQTERQAQSLLALGTESLQFMAAFTAVLPSAFLRPEILDRLTAMLNFNLVLLAGPRCSALKVQNPAKYNFNPRALLAYLLEVYLSLADEQAFVASVGADERSFSPLLFASVQGIMKRTGMDVERIEAFAKFAAQVNELTSIKQSSSSNAEEEIPDEFLDPILFTVMSDPVLLPASQMIVDRATITAHLLNDPHDPFNRQPLSIDQVQDCPEMKAKIEAYFAEKKK